MYWHTDGVHGASILLLADFKHHNGHKGKGGTLGIMGPDHLGPCTPKLAPGIVPRKLLEASADSAAFKVDFKSHCPWEGV